MQTLLTLPAESLAVILTAGVGFVASLTIVTAYIVEKPARTLATFVASFFM